MLAATGRRADTQGLGLERLGVNLSDSGKVMLRFAPFGDGASKEVESAASEGPNRAIEATISREKNELLHTVDREVVCRDKPQRRGC